MDAQLCHDVALIIFQSDVTPPKGVHMRSRRLVIVAGIAASLAIVLQAGQGAPPAGGGRQGGRTGGAAACAASGASIGGTLTPAKPDARGWGWQVKSLINPATPRATQPAEHS